MSIEIIAVQPEAHSGAFQKYLAKRYAIEKLISEKNIVDNFII